MSNLLRLSSAEPIDPDTGFPLWFGDGAIRLEIVLNQDVNAPVIGEQPDLNAPLAMPGNFPEEAFYFMTDAKLPVGGNGIRGRARVIMALEAAFGGAGKPALGANVVFARIRVRMDDLIPGATYSVDHPYGEFVDLIAHDRGRVFHTVDMGITEGDPYAVLRSGEVAPFLRKTSVTPGGYIGDGATEQPITGGPKRNHVLIRGTRIREEGGTPDPADPLSMNSVYTNLFTVQGRLATRVGAVPTSATYEVAGGQTQLRVSARSDAGQDIRVVGNGFHFKLEGSPLRTDSGLHGRGYPDGPDLRDRPHRKRWCIEQQRQHRADDHSCRQSEGRRDQHRANRRRRTDLLRPLHGRGWQSDCQRRPARLAGDRRADLRA